MIIKVIVIYVIFINNNQNTYGEYQYAEFYGELNKK